MPVDLKLEFGELRKRAAVTCPTLWQEAQTKTEYRRLYNKYAKLGMLEDFHAGCEAYVPLPVLNRLKRVCAGQLAAVAM